MTKVTKAAMREWFKVQLGTNAEFAKGALLRIYHNQTMEERASQETIQWNGIGFKVQDANFMTKMAESLLKFHHLSDKQMACVFRAMPKYAGQLEKGPTFSWKKMEILYRKSIAC